jgi:uncharacterized protein (TIGR02996 family)
MNPYKLFPSEMAAICERPDDDVPRIRFAELLDTTDNPLLHARAEYIRVQCALARQNLSEHSWGNLYEREESLESRYTEEWWASDLPELKGVRFNSAFQRGFPYEIWCDDETAFVNHAETLLTSQPIRSLSFMQLGSTNFFRDMKELVFIKRLILEDLNLDLDDAQNIAASHYLQNVTDLHLSQNNFGDDSTRILAASKNLVSLVNLDLGQNAIGDDGVIAIADSDIVTNLEHLGLAGSRMTDRGAIALADSSKTRNVEAFTLWDCNNIGTIGQHALQKRFGERVSFLD